MIDTAGARCDVAACRGAAVVAARSEPMTRGHGERLFALVAEALAAADWRAGDIDAVVVCTGPGGFTGPRVGVAAARGLALALRRPAIGIDWFTALAGAERARVALTAPQGLVWLQRFRAGAPLGPIATVAPDDPALAPLPGERALGDAERAAAGPAALAAAALPLGAPPVRPAPLYLRPPDATPPVSAVA